VILYLCRSNEDGSAQNAGKLAKSIAYLLIWSDSSHDVCLQAKLT